MQGLPHTDTRTVFVPVSSPETIPEPCTLVKWMSKWTDALPESKFGVAEEVVDEYFLYKSFDLMVVEKTDFV